MKKLIMIVALASTLAGCGETWREQRAVEGGVIGAGVGAVIGGAAGHTGGAALAGAAIGGTAGAIIGANSGPHHHCYSHDANGRRYRVPCR